MGSIKSPVDGFVHVIHRYFIWLMVASYGAAAIFPTFGLWVRHVDLGNLTIVGDRIHGSLPLMMLATLLFNAGLGAKTPELRHQLRYPLVLLSGFFGSLAIPLISIIALSFAMQLWNDPKEVQQILVGLALVASMPIAGSSTAWTQNANGHLSLSLWLVLLTTMFSPILAPFVLHTVGFVTTGDYSEDLHELASNGIGTFLGMWVIAPSLLGILTHWIVGERSIALMMPYVKLINYGILLLLNYSNASLTLPQAVFPPDIDFLTVLLVITLALCLVCFASGYLLAYILRVGRDRMVALMFGLGMHNNGTGLVLASIALVDHPQVLLPIIFYNLVQNFVASSVDSVMFRRQHESRKG